MDITPQEAFKLGFFTRCAQERLTGKELETRLEKVAAFNKKAEGSIINFNPMDVSLPSSATAAKALTGYAQMAYTLPFAASILGGGALGYGAAKMVEPQISEDEIKSRELADTYRLYAAKAKARKKLRQYRG
jgi:hypothetical protein